MSRQAQLGQLQLGQNQYNGTYELDDHQDSSASLGRMRTHNGWGTFGRRRYVYPELWSLRAGSSVNYRFAEISILSVSGAVIGKMRSDVQKTIIQSVDFTIDGNGCSDLTIKLNALPGFPILPFSIAQIKIGNTEYNWYAGTIAYKDDEGVDQDVYEFSGTGLRNYLAGLNAFTTYTAGMDVGAVVDDICQTWIEPYCPIRYNSSKIITNTGVILATDIELSKHYIDKVLTTLADMAGYDWGVDGDMELYFYPRVTAVQRTFFVGYNVNTFKPKLNLTEVKNSIIVQRQEGLGSGGVGWAIAGLYSDDSSIKKYGKKELTYQVPGYFGDDECDIIGEALLAEKKEPAFSASITGFLVYGGDEYLSRGIYRIIMPFDKYDFLYSDVDDIDEWTKSGAGDLALSIDDTYFVHGDGCLKLEYSDAENDIAIFESEFSAGRIEKVRFYIRADKTGSFLTAGIGYGAWNQHTKSIDITAADKFIVFEWDVSSLDIDIIDTFGVQVSEGATAETLVWIDKLELVVKGHKYYTMKLNKTKYKFSPTDQSASIELGVLPPKMENYLAGLFATSNEMKFTQEIR